jgi:putative flippase GtrA
LWKHFLLQGKFALSGLVATTTDLVMYLLLVNYLLTPVPSNVISYCIAMVINFLFQKKFVFSLQGSVSTTFVLSIMVSIGGLLLSTAIVHALTQNPFLLERQYLIKLIAIMVVFFYNFYFKRLVFEKRFGFNSVLKRSGS